MDLQALGINITSIIIYTILFVAVYLIIKKFMVKPLTSILEQRKSDIQEGLDLKDQMQIKMTELDQKKEEILKEAKIEAKKMVDAAMEEAKAERKKLLEQSKQEADSMISKAKERFEQESKKMQAELDTKVDKAARKIVKEIYLQDKINIDKNLINKAINEIS